MPMSDIEFNNFVKWIAQWNEHAMDIDYYFFSRFLLISSLWPQKGYAKTL